MKVDRHYSLINLFFLIYYNKEFAMKILVVGGGGREHAIIRALKKSPDCGDIWCAPGNGGIGYDATCKNISATDVDAMVAFAKQKPLIMLLLHRTIPLPLAWWMLWPRWASLLLARMPLPPH